MSKQSRSLCTHVPWYKLDSHHAVHQTTNAPNLQQKQKAFDAYMDKKIQANATTEYCIPATEATRTLSAPVQRRCRSSHGSSDYLWRRTPAHGRLSQPEGFNKGVATQTQEKSLFMQTKKNTHKAPLSLLLSTSAVCFTAHGGPLHMLEQSGSAGLH